jgi:hypothetical protein
VPLQPPAVALEPRATVKLQPDVDIDLTEAVNHALVGIPERQVYRDHRDPTAWLGM